MYIAVDIRDDILCEIRKIADDDRELVISHYINQALMYFLKHREEADVERRAEIHALRGSLAGPEGDALAERVAAMRGDLISEERIALIDSLGGSMAGPKGEAFGERVAAARTAPWR